MALEWFARNSDVILFSMAAAFIFGFGCFLIVSVRTKWLANKLTLSKALRDADWEYIKTLEEQLSRTERNLVGRPGLRTSQASYEKAGLYVTH